MKHFHTLFLGLIALFAINASAAALDGAKIEQITGLKGKWNEAEHVFKITAPRTDVKIAVDGVPMPPFIGLTSWAAFTGTASNVMVMGDIVLFEDEVNRAMDAAFKAGLDVTALHNHFFFDQPKVYFMHIGGMGELEKLSTGVRDVLNAVKETRSKDGEPGKAFGGPSVAKQNKISSAPLEELLGAGEAKDGMFKVVIGRRAQMHGLEVGKEMGVNTWVAFAGDDQNALVDGDFAVLEDELQSVLRSLRKNGINIVAIHQHMTHEQPRIIFLHYWGKGKAVISGCRRERGAGRY
jgi:hypothetical protein